MLIVGAAPYANADNVVGSPSDITFNAGSSSTALKVKIVSNTAQSNAGDPVSGCNIGVKDDGFVVTVDLLITPAQGLSASPDPIVFDECNKFKTVTLTSSIGGIYTITVPEGNVVDNDPRNGVYHLEPFGEVRVDVVDNTPPVTTILSRPNNPTASQLAVFTFESNEAGSSFECSLDEAVFATCPDPASYPVGVGDHTFAVRATDPSGNPDPTPATFSWTVEELTIGITSFGPPPLIWGTEGTLTGTSDVVDITGLDVRVNWADGSPDTEIVIAADGTWTATHTYASSATYIITAFLMQGSDVKANATHSIFIDTREAILEVSVPETVTGETKFVASGTLKDATTMEGIDGLEIEFSGDGRPDDVTTQGVAFFGGIVIQSCDVGSDPGDCVEDDIGEANVTDNIVLHLTDGKITFPPSTSKLRIVFQNMGDTSFNYTIKEYPDTPVQCPFEDEGVFDCPATSFSDAPLEILAKSGGSAGGVTVFNGIQEISFSPGVDIGISALATRNEDSNPQNLHQINFDDLTIGSRVSGFTVDAGFYFAFGVAQFEPENGLELVAKLALNPLYTADDASAIYNVVANLQSAGGVGSETVQGSGTSIIKRGVTGDLDDDGLGDTDEGNCLTRNPSNTAETWPYSPSQSYPDTSSPFEDCPIPGNISTKKPDIYYEFDCMAGVDCPTQAELNLLEKAFDDATASKDINAHFHLSDTGLCSADQDVVAWFDGSSASGTERCDDFKSIKLYNFGTGTENDGVCTLASNCGTLIARAQAVGYVLIADKVNGCSTTGLGELYGRDVIIGTQCIFETNDAANLDEARDGMILHEIGHNLGLGHGGGKSDHSRDDVNCKPNHISVMTYPRNVPTGAMPAGSASASSAVAYYQGYHRGEIRVGSASGSTVLDESNLVDNTLVKTGTWKNRDGVTTITSFKLIWGDLPNAVRTDFTGNTLSWDGGRSPNDPTINLNGIPDVFVGGVQLPACTESAQFNQLQSPPDELLTMRNNIDEFQKTGTGISALGVGGDFDTDQDTDLIPEQNLEGVVLLNSLDQFQFLGVKQPLNNIFFGEPGVSQHKKGNTIPVQFNFLDQDGNEVTGDNALSEYGIFRIDTNITRISDFSTPPAGDTYFPPQTSTPQNIDIFMWDGSKWSLNFGTKNLQTGGTYAGRIYLHFVNTEEVVILDLDGDDISYMFKVVKG